MNNNEFINSLSIDEKANFLYHICDGIDCHDCLCGDEGCLAKLKEWLQKEHVENESFK